LIKSASPALKTFFFFQCIVKVVPYFSKNKILQVKEETIFGSLSFWFFFPTKIIVISFHNKATDNK